MSPELPQNVFRIVLIDQEILQHDIIRGAMVFKTVEKFLLILERYPGIRDKERYGIRAWVWWHSLHQTRCTMRDIRDDINITPVMAVADQTASFSTRSLDHVELKLVSHIIKAPE